MWNILICDDDVAFLQQLKKDIIKVANGKVKQIELFHSKEKFEFYLADNPNEVNIVFIDVRLEETSGIELAEHVLQLQPNSQIIFVSGYDKYFSDVYEVEHVYYLTKPVELNHLEKALSRAGEKIHDLQINSLVVSNKEGIHRIPFNEILFFENERRKIHIHTMDEKISYYGKFEDLISKLDIRFKRCHNSYIVNITKARDLCDKKFYFETGKMIPVSKTYYSKVRECFLDYLGQEIFDRGGVEE